MVLRYEDNAAPLGAALYDTMVPMPRVALIILDGFGVAPKNPANPRFRAKTPTLDRLERDAFMVTLQASGAGVGLPWGEPGNSEAGHLTIGAGRILYHYLPRIVVAIRDGSFFENQALKAAFNHVRRTKGRVHVMGLVSSGSVHAYIDHLYALFEMAFREGVPLFLHAFTDGRDAEPKEGLKFLPQIEARMKMVGVGRIASLCGRNFSMDRDGHWDRTQRAYRLLVNREGEIAGSVAEALAQSYARGVTDEFLSPTVIGASGEAGDGAVRDGDALIFFNFREDSARQLAESFGSQTFAHFPRATLQNFLFVTMSEYEKNLEAQVAFPLIAITETLGETIARAGLSQLRIAETEKYAHVTYFFNGGIEQPFPGEERHLIPSLSDVTADTVPEMRAREIAEVIVQAFSTNSHDVIIANFANGDMVGHTGNFGACVKALEAIDAALALVVEAAEKANVPLFVTADHGNIEEKIDLRTGRPLTEHSLNPVPFIAIGPAFQRPVSTKRPDYLPHMMHGGDVAAGLLTDVAPTILRALGVEKPKAMTGESLVG